MADAFLLWDTPRALPRCQPNSYWQHRQWSSTTLEVKKKTLITLYQSCRKSQNLLYKVDGKKGFETSFISRVSDFAGMCLCRCFAAGDRKGAPKKVYSSASQPRLTPHMNHDDALTLWSCSCYKASRGIAPNQKPKKATLK
jgi:hypothetical protein